MGPGDGKSGRVTGIILSGGKSLRMGEDKAFISVGGIPIIQRIQETFEKIFSEILIVANDKDRYRHLGLPVYPDLIPRRGALGGIYTGLFYATRPYAFFVASDMPFVRESVVRYLISRIEGEDALVPRTIDGLHPLHAIYSKNCLGAVKEVLDEGGFRVIDFFPRVNTKVIEEADFRGLDPMRESLINVNTPDDLVRIRRERGLPR